MPAAQGSAVVLLTFTNTVPTAAIVSVSRGEEAGEGGTRCRTARSRVISGNIISHVAFASLMLAKADNTYE